jgi:DNA-binding response OmpR family regulator
MATELTRNELRILGMLMRNAGAIVSREKLIQELWQDEAFIDDNTLTVNVNRLRKKLADAGLADFILTVKNQGYQIK